MTANRLHDLYLEMAARRLGKSIDEARLLYEEGDPDMRKARLQAKTIMLWQSGGGRPFDSCMLCSGFGCEMCGWSGVTRPPGWYEPRPHGPCGAKGCPACCWIGRTIGPVPVRPPRATPDPDLRFSGGRVETLCEFYKRSGCSADADLLYHKRGLLARAERRSP